MKLVVLENVRSAYNVGAIFRTADAAGVTMIYLTGYTPTPYDRFGRIQKEIEKTSLGACHTVPWRHTDDVLSLVSSLNQTGIVTVAVECIPNAIPLPAFIVPAQVAYIFGNEVSGVSDSVLTSAYQCVAIPMFGQKESLNVSVAAGIMMYHGLAYSFHN